MSATPLAAANPDFGPLCSEHRLKRSNQLLLLVLGLFLGAAGLAAVLFGLASLFGDDGPGPAHLCLPIALFHLAAAAWILWQAVADNNLSARDYARGLLIDRQTMRWDELEGACTRAVRLVISRSGVYSATEYRLVAAGGRQMRFMVFDRQIADARAFNDALYDAIARTQLPKAVAALQAGQTVQFGPFAVSRQGVSNKKETVPWSEVEWARLSDGYVSVKRRNKRMAWGHAGMMVVPNAMVFVNLVNTLATQAAATTGPISPVGAT